MAVTVGNTVNEPSTSTASSTKDRTALRTTATKRKSADAFQSLDAATEATAPPSKKAHIGRSLYPTLAKYGLKAKPSDPQYASLSKSTPYLSRARCLSHMQSPSFRLVVLQRKYNPPPPPPNGGVQADTQMFFNRKRNS
ncbi:hypothetical protein MSAN_00385500 [Mycena sanguinolenta]|uniref:Uncharacterized protein n=1 Tax=Mycena sanguinolenta TaxID=230812 RepID=A0A8H7DGW7_9AGAR|nr:hypothetical protein MSAN_00385500 [Mycena sanguinolenta]